MDKAKACIVERNLFPKESVTKESRAKQKYRGGYETHPPAKGCTLSATCNHSAGEACRQINEVGRWARKFIVTFKQIQKSIF